MSNFINYEGEKYYANIDNVKKVLNKYGVAIIPNILNNELCDDYYGKNVVEYRIYD